MRIGFDLDGTLADMHAALAREAARLFPWVNPHAVPSSASAATPDGMAPEASPAPEAGAEREPRFSTSALSPSQTRQLWNAACGRENFWETLAEIEPGAIRRLNTVARARRWEVIFLTSRPESAGDNAQTQSYRWLKANGFETPSVFVVHGSRGKIAAALALDVFVDDRPENCLDIAIDSQARAILVWRGEENKVPGSARQLGIGSVGSIRDCLDILESLDQERREGPSMVSRLKQLLGLRPRPARHAHPQAAAISGAATKV